MGVKPELIAKKYYYLAGGRVPVNLERLCRRLGFEVVEWNASRDFTAVLSVPHRIVVVNGNMFYARRRFSVAHELGHYAFGRGGVSFYRRRGVNERFANTFAAQLLMPKSIVISIWSYLVRTREPFLWRVRLLAYYLGVSAEAARVRLEGLGIVEEERRARR